MWDFIFTLSPFLHVNGERVEARGGLKLRANYRPSPRRAPREKRGEAEGVTQ